MMMDYESYYDVSDLEPTAYINKNGRLGYQLYWSPADSLSFSLATQGLIRNEQDRYLQDTFRHSDGLHMSANSSYQFEHRAVGAGIHASAERKDMDWEAYQNVSLEQVSTRIPIVSYGIVVLTLADAWMISLT